MWHLSLLYRMQDGKHTSRKSWDLLFECPGQIVFSPDDKTQIPYMSGKFFTTELHHQNRQSFKIPHAAHAQQP